jgi:hypothetical protein
LKFKLDSVQVVMVYFMSCRGSQGIEVTLPSGLFHGRASVTSTATAGSSKLEAQFSDPVLQEVMQSQYYFGASTRPGSQRPLAEHVPAHPPPGPAQAGHHGYDARDSEARRRMSGSSAGPHDGLPDGAPCHPDEAVAFKLPGACGAPTPGRAAPRRSYDSLGIDSDSESEPYGGTEPR